VGTGFHSELTGRENIFLNGAILGMSRQEIQRKFDEIMDFAEIEQFIDTPVKHFSSGMYMRLAFAVAAHLEPEILLVDEVLAVGDAEFQKKCLGKMGDVAHEGRTVLFVSHNIAAVQSICSKGILLESGKLALLDSVQHVTESYISHVDDEKTEAIIDLEKWPNREGKGGARIVRMEVLDCHGNPINQVSFRDCVHFRLICNFPEAMEATFGVLVHSLLEVPLIDLRSTNSNIEPEKLSGCVIVEAEVDALNLYPGEYYLSPWIMDKNAREDIDFVHYCGRLSVMLPLSKGPVMQLDPVWGKFVVESKWNIKH
jgi:lipopolysaccharide transport system ATP-binding protein